jgi:hypothetical protein
MKTMRMLGLVLSSLFCASLLACVAASPGPAGEPGATEGTATPGAGERSAGSDDPGHVGQAEQELNGQHYTCAGHCDVGPGYGCEWYYDVCRPDVTVNCRDRIVEYCHNRGLGFGNAWWTPSCEEGYTCLYYI